MNVIKTFPIMLSNLKLKCSLITAQQLQKNRRKF